MKKILIVDLDGTLLKTDLLYESFWSSFSKNWKIPFKSIFWAINGRANLKQKLAEISEINIDKLPYNKEVINYIKKHKKKGGFTGLVTASNQLFADKISKYLNLFDEAIGSTQKINLIGNNKAKFLKNHYGYKNFDYMGDSFKDLPVWQNSNKAITVNANHKLIKECEKVNSNFEHLDTKSNKKLFFNFLKIIRIYQWIKNLLIFVPMIAAHNISIKTFTDGLLAFICFSLIASSIYIVNDLLDLEYDRLHPYKKFRSFASGDISIKNGLAILFILLISGLLLSFQIGIYFIFIIIFYFFLSNLYSVILKKIYIFDTFVIGLLYTTRIQAGGFASEIDISPWLLSFSIFFFISLASIKRLSELVDAKNRNKLRIIGRNYFVINLKKISLFTLSSGIISIIIGIFYILSPETTDLYPKRWTLALSILILSFWFLKMILDSLKGLIKNDPIIFALSDLTSRFCFLAISSLLILNFI
jgi:4-hydroxybenzoate polyprenyltransferase